MRLKLPPPLWWFLSVLLMWALKKIPIAQRQMPASLMPALALAVVGFFIVLAGIWAFYRARTTVNPHHPERASCIVKSGVFRYSRNPMYLGMLILLMALSLWFGSIQVWFGPLFFGYCLTKWQIIPEEEVLLEKFGESYRAYCRTVRRWF